MSQYQVVVLAGGKGSRLGSLASRRQKVMIEVCGKPVLEWTVRSLIHQGFHDLAISVAYRKEDVIAHFERLQRLNAHIRFVHSDERYGTVGAVQSAYDILADNFLVIYGDMITDFHFWSLFDRHLRNDRAVTLVLARMSDPTRIVGRYGVVTIEHGLVTSILEKPQTLDDVSSSWVAAGIFAIRKEFVELGQKYDDFSKDLFLKILGRGVPINATFHEGYWRDAGHVDELLAAHRDCMEGRLSFLLEMERTETS